MQNNMIEESDIHYGFMTSVFILHIYILLKLSIYFELYLK